MGNLTANMLRGSLEPGRHHDGDGLFLNLTPTGARSWICRVQKNGRRRDIGLGSAKKVSLAQARQRSAEVRSQVEAGIDPVLQRKKAEGIPSFREAAAAVYAENKKSWKNKKHLAALHFSKVAAFVGKLRERESIGRLAFEFLILTAARSGEVR